MAAQCMPNKLYWSCMFSRRIRKFEFSKSSIFNRIPEIVGIYDNYPCLPVDNVIEDNKYCHEHSPSSALFIDRDAKTINSWHSSISNNVEDCNIVGGQS